MKMELSATGVLALAGIAGAAFLVLRYGKSMSAAAAAVGQGVADAANAVNPVNHDNIFATTVNKVGGAVAGDSSGGWTLGGWIYDATHPAYDPNAVTTLPTFTGGASGDW